MELNEVEAAAVAVERVATERFAALFDVEAKEFLARSASIKRSVSLTELHGRLGSIVDTLVDLLKQFGCGYKDKFVALAMQGVEMLAEFDLPYVPNIFFEPAVDALTRQYGKWLVESAAKSVCPG